MHKKRRGKKYESRIYNGYECTHQIYEKGEKEESKHLNSYNKLQANKIIIKFKISDLPSICFAISKVESIT